MGQWTDYFRIITPKPPKNDYVQDNAASSLYNNYSWYTKAVKNASSRFSKYQQYNNMDNDVDVARALDTIAEEMTVENTKTNLPFEIIYQNEDNAEVDENITMMIRAALRRFSKLQNFNSEIFDIARSLVKYGDAFYRKTSDLKKWTWMDPLDIIGVVINDDNQIVSYQLRKGNQNSGGFAQVDLVPAAGMVHFSLASSMNNGNPFGESVLRPAMKAYKQLAMLEDAVIIYRIVRAPERRVFFLDVGNMPPQKVKAYLEAVKNDVKQKRIPNESGGNEKIDSVVNPMSMVEDYYFAQTANGRGSRVETLSGGESLGEIADLNYFQNKFFKGLRIPSSYMRGQNAEGAQVQDGKVGLAYFEEQKFANYIKRLQNKMSPIFDAHFKRFLLSIGIKIDADLFRIELPEPQNFTKYRQAAIDAELLNNFGNVKDVPYMSKRMMLKTYLGWTEDDVQANEAQIRQEKNIPEGGYGEKLTDLRMIYDEKWNDSRPDIKVPDGFDVIEIIGEEPPPEEEAPPEEGEDGAPEGEDTATEEPTEAPPEEEAPAEEPPPKEPKEPKPPKGAA
jgi:hypothetical protein